MIHDRDGTKTVAVEPGMTIGRGPDNSCQIHDAVVSVHHARIIRDGEQLSVVDSGSSNGTRIADDSGKTLKLCKGESHPLRAGFTLILGKTRIDVVATHVPEQVPVDEFEQRP